MDFINKDLKINKYSDPFPHVIIENFLNLKFYNEIEKNFPLVDELKDQKNIVSRMNFDTTFGDYVYDPAQNVYLKGNQTIDQNSFYNALSDFYDSGGTAFGSETGSPVGYAQGGGTEFPRKTGMIDGPGTGQSDSIPAMLSDGEFVITKQAVVGLGNGSRDKGTKKLYSFMDQMEDKAKGMGIGKL